MGRVCLSSTFGATCAHAFAADVWSQSAAFFPVALVIATTFILFTTSFAITLRASCTRIPVAHFLFEIASFFIEASLLYAAWFFWLYLVVRIVFLVVLIGTLRACTASIPRAFLVPWFVFVFFGITPLRTFILRLMLIRNFVSLFVVLQLVPIRT